MKIVTMQDQFNNNSSKWSIDKDLDEHFCKVIKLISKSYFLSSLKWSKKNIRSCSYKTFLDQSGAKITLLLLTFMSTLYLTTLQSTAIVTTKRSMKKHDNFRKQEKQKQKNTPSIYEY